MRVIISLKSHQEPKIHLAVEALASAGFHIEDQHFIRDEEGPLEMEGMLAFDPPTCLDLEKDLYTRP